nr:hypothetical protein [Micromonospora tarapacensis]
MYGFRHVSQDEGGPPPRPLLGEVGQKVAVEQCGKRLGHFEALYLSVWREVQRFEQPLVDHPSLARRRIGVLPFALLGDDERRVERAFQVCNRSGGSLGGVLGVGHLACEPVHLGLQHVQRHGSGVVGGQQLLPLALQPGNALLGAVGVAGSLLAVGGQLVQDAITDQFGSLRAQPERGVEAGHAVFDLFQSHRLAGTRPPPCPAREAGVVLVLATVALVPRVDEPRAALAAEDGALQVVRVLALLLSRQVMRREYVLDP